MPQGEKFWNPYRWVEVSDQPIQHASPHYHHQFDGLSGQIACTLEALTPLIVGDGSGGNNRTVEFTHRKRGSKLPYIPATSLKGVIRSLAELVGNAAVPFATNKLDDVDKPHRLEEGIKIDGQEYRLDPCTRLFGFILPKDKKAGRDVDHQFAGLVQFSDGEVVSSVAPVQWDAFKLYRSGPNSNHRPFYPDNRRRKAYHHQAETSTLTPPHATIQPNSTVRPAPPGTQFMFTVDFWNLRDDELNLLLYCLILEEQVSVTLSKASLGPDAREDKTITGPMRHKVGGCKPQGGGSAHIHVTRLTIRTDPADRYRGHDSAHILEGEKLTQELQQRTSSFAQRTDKTMDQLRAMMIYTSDDPRRRVEYPTYEWFNDDKERPQKDKRRLKPTT